MIQVLVLCLALTAAEPKETAFPVPFGLNFNWKTEADSLKKQLAGIQADVKGFETRIGQLESKMDNVQLGIANSANSGTQWFSGDVGMVSIAGLFLVLLTAVIGYYRMQIKIHSSAGLILAASHDDSEAKDKANTAPPAVKQLVDKTIDKKNGGAVNGK